MIGIIILLISIVLYFNPKYRYVSYIIYLGFMLGSYGGYNILTDGVIGVKNMDLAIIYTFIISFYLLTKGKYKFPNITCLKYYRLIIIFLLCSVVFSYIHYNFSFYQILQGGRSFLLLFSLPILVRINTEELRKVLYFLYWITLITSVLYILQIVIGRPIMPYPFEYGKDASTGLVRLYNAPPLLDFFLVFSFIKPEYLGKRILLSRIIFFVALICTLGRTGIFTTILMVLLAMYFQGKASNIIKTVIIIGIFFIPFYGLVSERFEEGGTSDDISVLLDKGYKNYDNGDGGTMTFRLAWVYERFDYLLGRPIGEQIFGLGLISDGQPIVNRMYNFRVGLIDENTGFPVQLVTADIAYGNLLTKLGFLGSIIYLTFLVSLTIYFYKNRKLNSLVMICTASLIILFVGSLSGSALSSPQNLAIYFVVLKTIILRKNDELIFSIKQ